jgi:hypothetical protein
MATIKRNCPHCPAEHVAFRLVAADGIFGRPGMWNCLAVCGACGLPICFVASSGAGGSSLLQFPADIELHWAVLATWPSRKEPSAPPHAPPPVARRFLEGEDAYGRENWNSAVAMYRSALYIATKALDGVPGKLTFFKRLEWLDENRRITPEIRSWADHVRVEGNEALHDPDDFEENDAKPLRFFTEMFLRYVFELPGEVRAFREEVEGGTTAWIGRLSWRTRWS